ncbi:MAG: dTMP kinase [Alphaproteobacteria bacterium]
MFVALEGIDACGKATQAALLAHRLEAALFSFPDYSTPMGKLIASHLQNEWGATDIEHDPMVFQALQIANRMEHAQEIANHLAVGDCVVADRYTASGMVYGAADGLDLAYLEHIHTYLPEPDYYLLLDIDPQLSIERRPDRRDRYELQAGLMGDVAKRYRKLWADKGWTVIDGSRPVDEVTDLISKAINI